MTDRTRAWRRDERGQALVEVITFLPWLLLAALLAVQLQLVVSTATAAEHAARNAAVAARNGGDAYAAARVALSPGQAAALRPGDVAIVRDGLVEVELRVPIVISALRSEAWTVTRTAEMPTR